MFKLGMTFDNQKTEEKMKQDNEYLQAFDRACVAYDANQTAENEKLVEDAFDALMEEVQK